VCVYACMCVCMYVCMHVCMYVCMYSARMLCVTVVHVSWRIDLPLYVFRCSPCHLSTDCRPPVAMSRGRL